MFICLVGNGDEAIPMLGLKNHLLQMGGGTCPPPPPTPTVGSPTSSLSNTYVLDPTSRSNTYSHNTLSVPTNTLPNNYSWNVTPKGSQQASSQGVSRRESRKESRRESRKESQSSPLRGSQQASARASQSSHGLSSAGESYPAGRGYALAEDVLANAKAQDYSGSQSQFSEVLSPSKGSRSLQLVVASCGIDQSQNNPLLSLSMVPR